MHNNSNIHSTAIVSPEASIGEGTIVGPYSIIGPHVVIGKNNSIASHAVIEGHTSIGDENKIFQFASIGSVPQDLKYKGEPTTLVIGNRNLIREYVTLQPGTIQGNGTSIIGDGNLFMVGSHVAHDAIIGNSNVFANYCSLAGHVTVGNRVTIGGMAGIHQFVRLGDLCILGAGSMVAKDIPTFCMAQGDRAKLIGLNKIGLKRNGITSEENMRLRSLYRFLFYPEKGSENSSDSKPGTFIERVATAAHEYKDFTLGMSLISFLQAPSNRGTTFPRSTLSLGSRAAEGDESDD